MSSRSEGVVNTLGATNVAKSKRQDLDFYQTPSGAVQALVDKGLACKSIPVWEPMAGNGAIAKVLKQNGYNVMTSDIVKRKYELNFTGDFFEFNTFPDLDNIKHTAWSKPVPLDK